MPNVVLQSRRFQTKLITRRPFATREEPRSGNSSTSWQKRRPWIFTKLATIKAATWSRWFLKYISHDIILQWSCCNRTGLEIMLFCLEWKAYNIMASTRQSGMKKEIRFSLKMTLLMSFCFCHFNMVYCLLYFICFMYKKINTMYFSVCVTCLSWCRVRVDV